MLSEDEDTVSSLNLIGQLHKCFIVLSVWVIVLLLSHCVIIYGIVTKLLYSPVIMIYVIGREGKTMLRNLGRRFWGLSPSLLFHNVTSCLVL